jgi:hypothetical protein
MVYGYGIDYSYKASTCNVMYCRQRRHLYYSNRYLMSRLSLQVLWIHRQTVDRQTLDRQTLDRQTLDRQTLDTTNPGQDKPWTRQTLDRTNPGQYSIGGTLGNVH